MAQLKEILDFLGCSPARPSLLHLNRLIQAYCQRVPWETVFRIHKKHSYPRLPDSARRPGFARLPDEFWEDVFRFGGGGTCFENNYAFMQLLVELGYQGYLTINDMRPSIGCHASSVLCLDGQKLLVDVAIPILKALPIQPAAVVRRSTIFHTYYVRPHGTDCYEIERTRHPKRNIYTLRDIPVPDADYREAIEADYGDQGLFLDRIIIVKVIGDRLWRFHSLEKPYRMEGFGQRDRVEIALEADSPARLLAAHFKMNQAHIEKAFAYLGL